MTTWVLLRGLAREAAHWEGLRQALAAQPGRADAVLAIDLPGNGVRYRERSPANVPAMVDACRAELAQRTAAAPYLLVAMSLGAMVAMEWCAAAPHEVTGCVLINTSVRGHGPFWERMRPRNYARLAALLCPGLALSRRERIILSMTSGNPSRHPGLPAQWAAIAARHPVSPRNALMQLLAAARYAPPRQRPPVPMLVLASAADRLVSVRCSQYLAAAWDLPLKVHPSAGHDLPLDDPDWVLAQLGEWWPAGPLNHP